MDIKFNYDNILIMDCEKFLSISHCFKNYVVSANVQLEPGHDLHVTPSIHAVPTLAFALFLVFGFALLRPLSTDFVLPSSYELEY